MASSTQSISIYRLEGDSCAAVPDQVVSEEPLELRVVATTGEVEQEQSICVTMRTPGNDVELATGFLFTEGIIKSRDDLVDVVQGADSPFDPSDRNLITVHLAKHVAVDFERITRHFFVSSSCGVCGKSSIDALRALTPRDAGKEGKQASVTAQQLEGLPDTLRRSQNTFSVTGALHAAALFTSEGELVSLREDVGRHNALDKLIGSAVLGAHEELFRKVILVSGRAGFELVQKALVAGVKIFAAIGAPSSLAIELARENEMTLVGFLREGRFNIYSGRERIHFDRMRESVS